MGIVVVPTFGADPVTITGPTLDAKVDGLATEFNGSIDNDNIKAEAAIANSKLNLAAISQNITHSGTMTHSGTLTMTAKDISEAKGADIASATTTECYAADGNFMHITGTTTITSLGTAAQAGDSRTLVFDGILTLTHDATSLILPTGANITTAAGDVAIIRAETTANTRVVCYQRKDGTALSDTTVSAASQTEMEAVTSNTVMATPLNMKWHPGVAKVTGKFIGTATDPISYGVSYGMSGTVAKSATGIYACTMATAMSSADYIVNVTVGNGDTNVHARVTLTSTTVFTVKTFNTANSAVDADIVMFSVYGDQ